MSVLSEMSNEDMLNQMEPHRYSTQDNGWIANVDTGVFYIRIKHISNEGNIDHIKNCTKVNVELYDRGEDPDPEDLKMPDLDIGGVSVKFDVRCFPHIGIKPTSDVRFKEQ